MAGCSKETRVIYTLDKYVFLDLSVNGETYSNYGYLINQQHPLDPETQFIKTVEFKDADSVVFTAVKIFLGDKLQNGFRLGPVYAYLSFYKPGPGIKGVYRNIYFEPSRLGSSPCFFVYPSPYRFSNPINTVEFNITWKIF
jgi:hypothetical protein